MQLIDFAIRRRVTIVMCTVAIALFGLVSLSRLKLNLLPDLTVAENLSFWRDFLGGGARPLFGMAAFASGLATPFFFLALFPAYLKRMPRSGGWLERVFAARAPKWLRTHPRTEERIRRLMALA